MASISPSAVSGSSPSTPQPGNHLIGGSGERHGERAVQHVRLLHRCSPLLRGSSNPPRDKSARKGLSNSPAGGSQDITLPGPLNFHKQESSIQSVATALWYRNALEGEMLELPQELKLIRIVYRYGVTAHRDEMLGPQLVQHAVHMRSA
jgi:hypothetical protein